MEAQNKNINLNFMDTENSAIEILHGEASKKKPLYRKRGREIMGAPGTVYEVLSKDPLFSKIRDKDYDFDDDCFLLKNTNSKFLSFEINSVKYEITDIYKSQLKTSSAFVAFGINRDKSYTTYELAKFIKMNRSAFEKKQDAAELVSILSKFEAKVDNEIKLEMDQRANRKVVANQVVNSNIPQSFNLMIPIFEGMDPQRFNVEIVIDADDYSCSLISPEARDYESEIVESTLEEEISKIIEIHPHIKVITTIN